MKYYLRHAGAVSPADQMNARCVLRVGLFCSKQELEGDPSYFSLVRWILDPQRCLLYLRVHTWPLHIYNLERFIYFTHSFNKN